MDKLRHFYSTYRDTYEGSGLLFLLLGTCGAIWGMCAIGIGFAVHAPQPALSIKGILSLVLLFPVWGSVPILAIGEALGVHSDAALFLVSPLVGVVISVAVGHFIWYRHS